MGRGISQETWSNGTEEVRSGEKKAEIVNVAKTGSIEGPLLDSRY